MSIPFPPCVYPATLDERGPKEDPSILLTGMAAIGNAPALVIAIRISRTPRRTPDYRHDVPTKMYSVNNIDVGLKTFPGNSDDLTDEPSDALGEQVPSIVQLEPGTYMLWILPLTPDSGSAFD
jgi:hypothetical protein